MELFADIVGVTGTILLILAYFLLQAEKIKSDDDSYLYMNAIAAVLILFSLCYSFNLASFIIEIFWIAISIYGIWKKKKKVS
jgi:predicted membrane protein